MSEKELGAILLFGYLGWLMYMYTFRTEDMMKIQKQHDERMGKVANTAGKAGGFLVRIFKR